MEPTQLISQEWDFLSGQFTAEEADFMTHFLGGNTNYSYFPANSANIFSTTTNIDSLGEDAKFSPQYLDDSFSNQISYECIDLEWSGLEPGNLVPALGNSLQAKREHEMNFVSESPSGEDRTKNMENPAKRFRSSNDSMELNDGTCPSISPKEHEVSNANLCRKSRARNGPATDSQSIYARRRRERINERLRILQTLVPNGTKVDISTMLEEAVQYVKFLQLQIKILSSDDTWMYAPIAYNGINIGLDLTFS
ncbi:unnamed protein product [Lathyrus sativus]|nr:unnamed protein product [Lathyrus sativus]